MVDALLGAVHRTLIFLWKMVADGRTNSIVTARLIGNKSKFGSCNFSLALTLYNLYLRVLCISRVQEPVPSHRCQYRYSINNFFLVSIISSSISLDMNLNTITCINKHPNVWIFIHCCGDQTWERASDNLRNQLTNPHPLHHHWKHTHMYCLFLLM